MNIIGGDVLSKCLLAGIKGEVNIKLVDEASGRIEFEVEEHNMFFPQVFKPFLQKAAVDGILYNMNLFSNDRYSLDAVQGGSNSGYPQPYGVMVLSMDDSDEDINETSFVKNVIGGAYTHATYAGASTKIGTLNVSESVFDVATGKFTMVFDFATSVANGSFQSVALLPLKKYQDPLTSWGKLVSCGAWYADIAPEPNKLIKSSVFTSIPISDNSYNNLIGMKSGKLLIRNFGGASNNLFEIDLSIGDVANLGHTLKDSAGANVDIVTAVIVDGYLYAIKPSTSRLLKWALTNLTANATEYNLTSLFGSNLYAKVFPKPGSATRYYFHPYSQTANDPAVGEPYWKFIYEIDAVAGTVIRRIRYGLSDGASVASSSYSKGTMWCDKLDPDTLYVAQILSLRSTGNGDNEDGTLSAYPEGPGTTYNSSISIRQYDLVEEEFVGSLGDIFGVTNGPNYNSSKMGLFYDWNDNKLKFISPSPTGNYYMLKEAKFVPKTHRVKLPAPVTKVNTQTMKVTYSITVDPANLITVT